MKKILSIILFSILFSCNNQKETEQPQPLMSESKAAITGKTYYVSILGSDSNNGTSESTPWQSMSKAESFCNSGKLLPGDRILFRSGDKFTGTITIATIWGKQAKSGTIDAPITFGSYGTGAKPEFLYPTSSTASVTNRIIMTVVGLDYYVIENIHFTDLDKTNDKIKPANCGMALYLGSEGEDNDAGTTNYCTVRNVDIDLCGMGIVLIGDFNRVEGCRLTDFKNLKSTPNTGGNSGDDDYASNPITLISADDNEIVNNYISGGWSSSFDYGWNGGACEVFNSCHRNKLMYNTIYDCGGVAEFGGYATNASANDNVIAYNKIINCGTLTWCNISGSFAIQVSNLQYYGNVIIENNESRFSGPNTGRGLTAFYKALIETEQNLFAYNGSPTAAAVFVLKNNVFHISTGMGIARTNDPKTIHTNNIYKLSNGSKANVTLNSTEITTSAEVFKDTKATDPISWDYTPTSLLIKKGVYVGINKDFAGNTVDKVTPNIGIYESGGVVTPPDTIIVTPPPCETKTETQTVACPAGQTGSITQQRTFNCLAATWSNWVTVASNCSTVVTPPTVFYSLTYNQSNITITSPKSGSYRLYKKVWFWTSTVKTGSYSIGKSTVDVSTLNGTFYITTSDNSKAVEMKL